MSRLASRKRAKEQLAALQKHEENVIIIHYSCENFYDRHDGSSPRITSIAVRNLGTEETRSFSIHHIAEYRDIQLDQIAAQYDELEFQMLTDFFEYVSRHQQYKWLNWKMRNTKFGFPALEHRFRVLDGEPITVDDSRKIDLARILNDLYGADYIGHPRLLSLIRLNDISQQDYLDGQDEANAFTNGEFVKLHQSTLRKVDSLANIYERLVNRTLKTQARRMQIYGGLLPWIIVSMKEHWFWMLVAMVTSIVGILKMCS